MMESDVQKSKAASGTQIKSTADQHGLHMKIKMTRLYRSQVMKPLVNKIMSLQLTIEREMLPRLVCEVDWNLILF